MLPLTPTSDFVFIRRERQRVGEQCSGISAIHASMMALAAPDVPTDALRCLTLGSEALTASEPTELRAQSDACIGFAEIPEHSSPARPSGTLSPERTRSLSRRRKTEGQITSPIQP